MINFARLSIAGVIAAAGCASVPVSYYTLSPTPPSAAEARHDVPALEFPPARVPPQVNRREIVLRQSGDRLALLENEQWASPLGDEISSAALLEFSAQMGKSDPGMRQQITTLGLSIDVRQFDAVMGRQAVLSATWNAEIHQGGTVVKVSCPFAASRQIAAGVSGVVVGYQQAVAELGDAMARGVLDSLPQHTAVCSRM